MSEADLYFWWVFWLTIAAVITIAAAVLLITVIIAARRILKLARQALGTVEEIEKNTNAIWQLDDSDEVANELLTGAQAIKGNAVTIVSVLGTANKVDAA